MAAIRVASGAKRVSQSTISQMRKSSAHARRYASAWGKMYWVRVSTVRLPRAIHSVSTTSTSVTTGGKASRSAWSQAGVRDARLFIQEPFLSLPERPNGAMIFEFASTNHGPRFPIIILFSVKSNPNSGKTDEKLSSIQPAAQLLPERSTFLLRQRQFCAHQNGIQPDLVDLLPGDGQRLVPPQQPEQMRPAQQKQAPDLRGLRVKFQIIGPAQAGPIGQLHDLFGAKLPECHRLPSPLCVLFYCMRQDGA